MRKLMLVASAALLLLPLTAAARGRVGGFAGRGFVSRGWYGYGGFFDPYPYWGSYYGYGPYFGTPNAGEVKLTTDVKDAQVFINGAYAGTAGKLKSMWMRPGAYTIEVRAPGRARFAEKIYVVAGKTLRVQPGLEPEARP